MKRILRQSGATLVVSMVMLVVLTLLVVSAIRSSTTNLRIAGNMQAKGEASAAAQQAIEQVLDSDFTISPIAQAIEVPMGAVSYTVQVTKPVCANTVPVPKEELNKSNTDDLLCFGNDDPGNIILDDKGMPIDMGNKCNKQVWEIQADVANADTGSKVNITQGVGKRTYLPTDC